MTIMEWFVEWMKMFIGLLLMEKLLWLVKEA